METNLLFYSIKYAILEGKMKFNHRLCANIDKASSCSCVNVEIVFYSLRRLNNLPSGCKDVSAYQGGSCRVLFALVGDVSRWMKGEWRCGSGGCHGR